jgi:hypothetical protein
MKQAISPIAVRPWTVNGISERMIVSHYENNYGSAVRILKVYEHAYHIDFGTNATARAVNQVTGSIAVEQNTLKRRGVGLRACDPERACPGYTPFAPCFAQNCTVYLVDLQGEVVHTREMSYAPGLSGYLTERGTLIYNGRTLEGGFLGRFPRTRPPGGDRARRQSGGRLRCSSSPPCRRRRGP